MSTANRSPAPDPPLPAMDPHRWHAPARVEAPELLDLGEGAELDVRASLNDLWRINRFLGGAYILRRWLYPRLVASDAPVVCLDLGAGSGEMARAIAEWAGQRGRNVRVVALDLAARHLALARERAAGRPHVSLLQSDALALPLASQSVDYVFSSLFIHHFAPEALVALLREADRVARRGILMSDATRGLLTRYGFRALQPVFARSAITRYDGDVSARRAYTPRELRALAHAGGLRAAWVERPLPWLMALMVDR